MINTIGERRPLRDSTNNYNNVDYDICSEINHKHIKFIEKARKEAFKSTMQHKHGCVVVSRNKIISVAHNIVQKGHTHSIHAEVNALKKIKNFNKYNDYQLYVVRVGTEICDDRLKYSKPCENCTNTIISHGINKIYYSLN